MSKTVTNVYGDLLDFCRKARLVFVNEQGLERKWTSIRVFIRVQWEPFEASFGTIDSNLQHHLEVLLHSAQALQFNAIQSGNRDADLERRRVRQRETVEERKLFLHWLSGINFDEDHDEIYSKRHNGTGNWIIQRPEFQQWFDSQASALLWCFGKPGIGKSVLASIVLEHITAMHGLNDMVGVAFVYFKYDSPDTGKPSRIVSTFIKQLCWKKEQIPQHLLEFYHMYDRDVRTPALDKYQENFFRVAKSYDQIFLVFDALDECKQDEQARIIYREQIMDFVFDLVDTLPCAKVFVTSRREADIKSAFARHKTPTIEIETRNVVEDINAYVCDRVEELVQEGKLRLRKPPLKEIIVQTLIAKAEGMFLWVNLQLLNICKQRSDEDIEAELRRIPRGLDRTYERVLRRLHQQPIALQELAKRCLVWVFYAARVLHIKELLEAVQIEDSAGKRKNLQRYGQEAVIEACANLIEVSNSFVRPIHYSVTEYLTGPKGTVESEQPFLGGGSEFLTTAHIALSRSCLSYLLQGFLNSGPCRNRKDFYRRAREFRLASYSSYFFDSHLRQVPQPPEDLRNLLKVFLSSENTTFAAVMQLRSLGGRELKLFDSSTGFVGMSWETNASTVIRFTALLDHPCLQDDIEGLLLTEPREYVLHQAADAGSLSYVAQLVREGYEVDKFDSQNRTPLHCASGNGYREICSYLLEHGAHATARTGNGETVLHCAAMGGHEAVVRLLLENYNIDINSRTNSGGTVLHYAALSGNTETFRLLVDEYKADNAARLTSGMTVLHCAALSGNTEMFQLLVDEYKADIAARTSSGETTLHCVALSGNTEMFRLLVDEYKADIAARTSSGETALHYGASGGNIEMFRLLVDEYKADIAARTSSGRTVLHCAAQNEDIEVLRLLVDEYKADIAARTSSGRTALHYAAANRNIEVLQLLVDEYKADIAARTHSGETALHYAASDGNVELVQLLVEGYKADITAGNNAGWTALHYAAWKGHKAVVQLLVEGYKADVGAKTNLGETALDLAVSEKHEAVIQLLSPTPNS